MTSRALTQPIRSSATITQLRLLTLTLVKHSYQYLHILRNAYTYTLIYLLDWVVFSLWSSFRHVPIAFIFMYSLHFRDAVSSRAGSSC